MKKLLSFALALVMIISLVPMNASAEEFQGEFATLDELKDILAKDYTFVNADYIGSEPLVITGELTLKQGHNISAYEQPVIIAEGAVVTANNTGIYTSDLTVNGTLILNDGYLRCVESLKINGEIQNKGHVEIDRTTILTGEEKITYVEYGMLYVIDFIDTDMAALLESLSWAGSDNRSYVQKSIVVNAEYEGEQPTLTLSGDLTVPVNTNVSLQGVNLIIPEGVTMFIEGALNNFQRPWMNKTSIVTVDGTLNITSSGNVGLYDEMVVNGKLVNEGLLSTGYGMAETAYIGCLRIGENAAYEGKGGLYISRCEGFDEVDDYLTGLDTSIFTNVQEDEWGWTFSFMNSDPGYGNPFSTIEELKALIAAHNGDYMEAVYTGSDPLVLEGELTVPQNMNIAANGKPVVVAEGAVVTFNNSGIFTPDLTVNGTIVLNDGFIRCEQSLQVNGEIQNKGNIEIDRSAAFVGIEKITCVDYGGITLLDYFTADENRLREALSWAKEDTRPNVRHFITAMAYYEGAQSTITLTEDMVIPDGVSVMIDGVNLVIPEDVILSVEGGFQNQQSPWMNKTGVVTVDGTLHITESGSMALYDEVVINGKLINESYIYISYGWAETPFIGELRVSENAVYEGKGVLEIARCEGFNEISDYLSGVDTSAFTNMKENDWGWIFSYGGSDPGNPDDGIWFTTLDELKELIANHNGDYVTVRLGGTEPLVITGELSIPDKFSIVNFNGSIEIAEGAHVTVGKESMLQIGSLKVAGTLENNGYLYCMSELNVSGTVRNNVSINVMGKAHITGSVKNNGMFYVMGDAENTGLDRIEHLENSRLLYTVICEPELALLQEKLAVAENESRDYVRYVINMYPEGPAAAQLSLDADLTIPANVILACAETQLVIPAGRTITLAGSFENYAGNPFVVEGTLIIEPTGRMTNMNNVQIKGSLVNNGVVVLSYSMASEDQTVQGKLEMVSGGSYQGNGMLSIFSGGQITGPQDVLSGMDLSSFTIMSEDYGGWTLTLKDNEPDWPTEDLPLMPEGEPDEVLDTIVGSGDYTAEQKLAIVQDIGAEELSNAMTSVDDRDNVVGLLIALEKELGGLAEVSVSDAPFEADKILVVGATLNSSNGGRIGLVIGQSENEHDIPEEYDAATAIRFSMDLKNATNSAELDVPVEIVMPLPEGFDPEGTVILHYHGDGVSTIYPAFDNLDNGYLVRFVITGFSDFIMTAPAKEEEHGYAYGDVNHDGDVKISDAILVMKYRAGNLSEGDTFCERCANVKGEGSINIQSAILIMKKRANKNMLFPVELQ